MNSDIKLLDVLRSTRELFDQNHPGLSAAELEQQWLSHMADLASQTNSPASARMTRIASHVPQKRPASSAVPTGPVPSPKRLEMTSFASSVPLSRHLSDPAGTSNNWQNVGNPRPTAFPQTGSTAPRSIPVQRRQSAQNPSRPPFPYSTSLNQHDHHRRLCPVSEIPAMDFSPQAWVEQSSMDFANPPTIALTASPVQHHREFFAHDISQLSVPVRPTFTDGSYSPFTTTSNSSFTSGSTATSEPVSICNAGEIVCDTLEMLRINSSMSNVSNFELQDSNSFEAHSLDDAHQPFPPSLKSGFDSDFFEPAPPFPFSFDPSPHFFDSGFAMKHSPSQGSASSESSESQSRMSRRVKPHGARGTARRLAPKTLHNDARSSDEIPEPKIIAVTAEDGTVRHKAEISRTTRHQPQRKTTFCSFCNDQPSGFHGDHELRRHIERHHSAIRKVWICRDASEDGTFLANCKACRNSKTYGANYNAAAHLRRAHFNPCKTRRGGRRKTSENRGGMGGGNKPSMEFLKNWMYEGLEMNINGTNVIQKGLDGGVAAHVAMSELTEFMPFGDNVFEFDGDFLPDDSQPYHDGYYADARAAD